MFRAQESERALKESSPGCGASIDESRASSALVLSSSRTSRAAPKRGCARCGAICTNSVIERAPWGFEPATLERLTDEAASSSSEWPTPSAVSYGTNRGGAAGRVGKIRPSLAALVKEWPTPTVQYRVGSSAYGTESGRHPGTTLGDAIREWPTPTGRDWKSSASNLHGTNSRPLNEVMRLETSGRLNPAWVETLMGFPEGWIDGPPDEEQVGTNGSRRARRKT